MTKSKLKALVIFGSVIAGLGFGALDSYADDTSEELWFDYNPGWKLSETTRFSLDAGLRKQLEDQGYLRLVLTPAVDYKVNKIKLAAGVANYVTFNQVIDDRWEIRPFQSASYIWPNNRFSLDHRVRLEERFDLNTATWESKNSLRGRYRLRLRYRLKEHQRVQFWSLITHGELFYTLAGTQGQTQEKTRLGLGMERTFKSGRRFRFEVVWQRQGRVYNNDNTADVIYFRFRYLRSW